MDKLNEFLFFMDLFQVFSDKVIMVEICMMDFENF